MKPDRLALMTRLARLRDEEAGRTVQQWRAALDTSQRQADMLRQYRRNLSAAQLTGRQAEGRTLHTFAEFAAVAERAHRQAYETVKNTQQQYEQALQDWYDKRRKTQVLTDKQAREEKQRQREQRDREDRASQEADAANRR
ncbi:hypothetical protein [Salinisphaera sp. RV14]|uniref:hypothetical protein n=2 Tax=unclassified Salinisphaera TaxID=2649847 RepID=UPI003F828CDA